MSQITEMCNIILYHNKNQYMMICKNAYDHICDKFNMQ